MAILNQVRNRLRHSIARDAILLYRHRGLTRHDVFLASYPKSGNTWMRHLLATLTGGREEEEDWRAAVARVGLQVGNHFGMPGVLQHGGRLIKTHEAFRSVYRKTILLVRDGRDVAVSEYHYRSKYRPSLSANQSFDDFVDQFLAGQTGGYGAWHRHTKSWLQKGGNGGRELLCVRYEDMKSDTLKEVGRVCDFLQLDVGEAEMAAAIEKNTAQAMRDREQKFWQDKKEKPAVSFVRAAKAGGWREHFSDESLDKFHSATRDVMTELGYLPA